MVKILDDHSETALVQAVKENLAEFFLLSGQLGGDLLKIEPGIRGWFTGIPHPWFNGVHATHSPAGEGQQAVQQALNFFDARNVPAFTWWNDPALPADSWDVLLRGAGFSYEAITPGMAMDLRNLQSHTPALDHVTIQHVTDLDLLKTWVAVFAQGYPIPEEWSDSLFTLLASMGLEQPARHSIGYLDGRPVATTTLFLGAGVAGIYNVATLPEARGRGLGTAMTLNPLLEARQMGYRIGILQSSEMGYRVYERLGFRQVCLMEHYYWIRTDPGLPA